MTFKRNKLTRISFLCIIATLMGINISIGQGVEFNWQDIGPDNMGGRTRAIVVRKDGRLFAGSALGGLWTSNNGGRNWSQVEGFNKPQTPTSNVCMSISSIAVDPNNEDLMIVGTGELAYKYDIIFGNLKGTENINTIARGYYGFSGLPGKGVFVSTDGGKTFSNKNATWETDYPGTDYSISNPWLSVQKVAFGNGRAFAATLEGFYYSDDLFRSDLKKSSETYTDNIETPKKLANAVVYDIEVAGSNVYVSTAYYIFVSRDNGATFSEVYGGEKLFRDPFEDQPKVNPNLKGRIELAIAPSDNKIIYAVEIADAGVISGFWISRDEGRTWGYTSPALNELVSSSFNVTQGRGVYSLALTVDPTNPNYVYLGSSQLALKRPQSGWRIIGQAPELFPGNPTYIPINIHTIVPDPNNKLLYYVGTDREIVRMRITPPYAGLKDTTVRFEPATGNYNTSGVISVAVNGFGGIFASTENAGVVFKDARTQTGSFNLVEENTILTRASGRSIGMVASSIMDTSHFLTSAGGFYIQRTLDAGLSYESLFSNASPEDTCGISLEAPSTDVIGDGTGYGITPFALKEVVPSNDPYVSFNFARFERFDTVPNPRFGELNEPRILHRGQVAGRDSFNINKEQYVFAASRKSLWRGTNPFANGQRVVGRQRETDTIATPMWIRLNNLNQINFETADGAQPSSVISCVSVSPGDENTVYVGTVDGRLYRVTDADAPCRYLPGGTFEKNPDFKIDLIIKPKNKTADGEETFPERWITSVTIKPDQTDTILVTYGGYDSPGDNDNISMIFASFNASAPKPDFYSIHNPEYLPYLPIYCALFNPKDPNGWLAIGTENGIYVTDPKTLSSAGSLNMVFTEANDGAMARVPVFGFAYQEYGFGVESVDFSIRIVDGSGGTRVIPVQFSDIADFYADELSYPNLFTKHQNIFSRNMSLEVYSQNYARLRDVALKILPLQGQNREVNFLNGILTKKSNAPQDEVLERFDANGLEIRIVKTKGIYLPNYAEKSVGKLFVATYGRGVMATDILLENGKTTNRPKENEFARFNDNLIQVYPNPTNGEINVSVKIYRPDTKVSFDIFSMDGRQVGSESYNTSNTGRIDFPLNLSYLPTGIYVIKGSVENGSSYQTQSLKLFINR